MSRAQQIIDEARLTLADPDKSRWSDQRLLMLLNVAQVEIASKAFLVKRTVTLPVFKGQASYVLPDDIIWLERAYYNSAPLRMLDYRQVDVLNKKREGVPTAMLFNKHPRNHIVLYPTPSVTVTSPVTIPNNILGVATDLTDIDIKIYDQYGIITDIVAENLEVTADSPFGGISEIKQVMKPLEVYYVAEPKKIESLDEDPEISPVCDKALKLYVISAALLDDMDTQNKNNAAVFMQYYTDALNDIIKHSSRDYVSSINQVETNPYNGVFEWPPRP